MPFPVGLEGWGYNIQLILILSGFHIYKFTYLLKFICNPKINTHSDSVVIGGHAQNSEKSEEPAQHTFPLLYMALFCLLVSALIPQTSVSLPCFI